MAKIRICIGSSDGEQIARSHMGDTDVFYLYDLFADKAPEFVEKRDNRAKEMDHAQSDKMKAIIALVKDADVFVAHQKSPNFIKIANQTSYQPVVVSAKTIPEILTSLQRAYPNITELVARRRNGETFPDIPVL